MIRCKIIAVKYFTIRQTVEQTCKNIRIGLDNCFGECAFHTRFLYNYEKYSIVFGICLVARFPALIVSLARGKPYKNTTQFKHFSLGN